MNILISGAWQQANEYIQTIEKKGHQVRFLQFERDELPCDYEWVEGIIGNGIFLMHPIEKFTNLKYIQLTSAGFDRVQMDYVNKHNIEIHNAGGVYSIPMAEYAVCGVLQLYKQTAYFHENQKNHIWQKHRELLELYRKTVLIIGCGSVGTECAKRFSSFGCHVLGVDIKPYENEFYKKIFCIDELDTALTKADVVILTLPLTDDTKYLINANRFNAMKSGTILVNISRGSIVNTKDLIDALNYNLGGAILDVFEEEPLPENSPLWGMKNVIITPHNSFAGDGNKDRLSELILGKISEKGK